MRKKVVLAISTVAFMFLFVQLYGVDNTLHIGIRQSPPFSYKDKNGDWKGLSIELWENIAHSKGYKYTFQETGLKDLLTGVQNKKYDVGIGGITITSDREKKLGFSQPYISSTMGLAYIDTNNPWFHVLGKFISFTFLKIILFLIGVLLLAGFGVWLFERKKNEVFSGKAYTGLGAAFWWAAVTMTTVGYGDKSPRTVGGRIIGLLWMFTSVIVLTSFTAAIVSSLTVASTMSERKSLTSLQYQHTGTVAGSSGDEILKKYNIIPEYFNSCDEMVKALEDGKIKYIVYDLPMLQFFKSKFGPNFKIESLKQYRQDYGFVLPFKSDLRKAIDIQLLYFIHTPRWRQIKNQYLGNWTSDV
jgi:polar amino acid transport system substrate-binding protein